MTVENKNLFEFMLGVWCIITSIIFFTSPRIFSSNVIVEYYYSTSFLFYAIYFFAGLLICCGLFNKNPRYEAIGLLAYLACGVLQIIAILSQRGPVAISTIGLIATVCLFVVARIIDIYRKEVK